MNSVLVLEIESMFPFYLRLRSAFSRLPASRRFVLSRRLVPRFVGTLVALSIGLIVGTPPAGAQTSSSESREQPRKTGPVVDSNQPQKVANSSAIEPKPLNQAELGILDEADRIAKRLSAQSREAFHRGLMGLADYNKGLSAALRLKIEGAQHRKDQSARIEAHRTHAAALRDAVRRLAEFNQPASRGWAADLAEARLLATQADLTLAQVRDDRGALEAKAWQVQRLARQHLELRRSDLNVGHATLPQISRAAAQLVSAGVSDRLTNPDSRPSLESRVAFRTTLAEVRRQTERLAKHGAGLGRVDRLQKARFDLARMEGLWFEISGDDQAAVAARRYAVELSRKLFKTQLKYYERGTVSLRDLAESWQLRTSLHEEMGQGNSKIDEDSRRRRQVDLNRLRQLAEDTVDRRGRNAADVSLIDSFRMIEQLKSIRKSKRASGNSRNVGEEMVINGRGRPLYVVVYEYQLGLPIQEHLKFCDKITFWTWTADKLQGLERNFARLEEIAPDTGKLLGCYLWDYGRKRPMPLETIPQQCETGIQLLRAGQIEGMIFLASNICDIELPTVEYTRKWIDEARSVRFSSLACASLRRRSASFTHI